MGRTGFCYREAERLLHPPPSIPPPALLLLLLLSALLLRTGEGQVQTPQCRIQKCTTDFVSLTSHLSPALDGFDTEFCKALRAYSACTHRTSKSCRGNLVFHSAVLGISDLMSQRNCSKDGPMSSTHPETPVEPCNYHSRHQGPRPGGGEHAHPTYLFCGLFGDPHLRTFRDHFQTCKVEGAWPLIDNNFLSVQVTNVPVVLGSSATATNKITIIFKPYQKCTDQKVYQAVTDDLPAAFVDGTLNSVDATTKSLWIIEKEAARHVEIYAAYIGVTIVVRQLGRYLTLAVRMPEELAMAFDETQDLQLCMNGCPSSERIDQNGLLPLPALGLQHPSMQQSRPGLAAAFSLEAAMSKCREQLEVKYIYFHCCVFDLLTTGDANFTEAAYNALKDMETLHPMHKHAAEGHGGSWHIFPRSDAGPVRVATVSQLLLLCCLLTLLF
ncbi:repulsive guidance molecule B [Denticeps clupeoides]|uniref:RGM domain family member B n=1 Tax=Denticeps clupeoides TaxID=299321 RepID=A0AAY4BGU6_9TELE|nr:RGM domain family member B [Denticeps clupeoides]